MQAPALPFAHLNLRRNPFGEPPREQRGALAVVDLEAIVPRLRDPRFAVQVIADCGRGKSTHLLALHDHAPAAPFVYVAEGERPRLPPCPPGQPFFLDEAQRVPRWRRLLLYRRAGALVLGTHQDLEGELRATGREVVTIRPDEALDDEHLAEAFRRRVEWARRGPGPVPRVPPRTIQSLRRSFGTDVRAMERALYEALQRAREIGDVEL